MYAYCNRVIFTWASKVIHVCFGKMLHFPFFPHFELGTCFCNFQFWLIHWTICGSIVIAQRDYFGLSFMTLNRSILWSVIATRWNWSVIRKQFFQVIKLCVYSLVHLETCKCILIFCVNEPEQKKIIHCLVISLLITFDKSITIIEGVKLIIKPPSNFFYKKCKMYVYSRSAEW